MASIECMYTCAVHTHDLRRVSPLVRTRNRKFEFSSKSGIDVIETVEHHDVDRSYLVVLGCMLSGPSQAGVVES